MFPWMASVICFRTVHFYDDNGIAHALISFTIREGVRSLANTMSTHCSPWAILHFSNLTKLTLRRPTDSYEAFIPFAKMSLERLSKLTLGIDMVSPAHPAHDNHRLVQCFGSIFVPVLTCLWVEYTNKRPWALHAESLSSMWDRPSNLGSKLRELSIDMATSSGY